MKLNLACGRNPRDRREGDGWINVDLWPAAKPDKVLDLFTLEWWKEFGESTVDEIYCGHFLEHVPHFIEGAGHKDGLFIFIDNCYKVLKDGAIMRVRYPNAQCTAAYIDPTHHRFITCTTARYFDLTWRRQAQMDHYPMECDFSYRMEEIQLLSKTYEAYSRNKLEHEATRHWNIVQDEQVVMTCHKPAREATEYKGP